MEVEIGSALLQRFLCDEVVMPFCSLRCGTLGVCCSIIKYMKRSLRDCARVPSRVTVSNVGMAGKDRPC